MFRSIVMPICLADRISTSGETHVLNDAVVRESRLEPFYGEPNINTPGFLLVRGQENILEERNHVLSVFGPDCLRATSSSG
jgi:hypothetical protein